MNLDVTGLLGLLRILSPNSTFIIAKTLYIYSNFSKKKKQTTTTKKLSQFIRINLYFLGRKFVMFVVIMEDRITIKIQRYMRLPGSNFQGLCYGQTVFFILGILGN